jgi:hypothetical protein
MRDRPFILLLAAVATLTVAIVAVVWSTTGAGPAPADEERWQIWTRLEAEERVAIVRLYQELTRHDDARAILAGADRFAALDDDMRARRRAICAAIGELETELPASQRRTLQMLPPEGRAAQLYQLMEKRRPGKLQALIGPPLRNN